jgi:Txe/YoeB family toxin of Txe-Axe toxin-antitoxin module
MSRQILWTKEAAKDLEFWKKANRPIAVRISKLI